MRLRETRNHCGATSRRSDAVQPAPPATEPNGVRETDAPRTSEHRSRRTRACCWPQKTRERGDHGYTAGGDGRSTRDGRADDPMAERTKLLLCIRRWLFSLPLASRGSQRPQSCGLLIRLDEAHSYCCCCCCAVAAVAGAAAAASAAAAATDWPRVYIHGPYLSTHSPRRFRRRVAARAAERERLP